MGEFYLIGIDYRDVVEGPHKLEGLYARIKPDLVISNQSESQFEAMREIFSAFSRNLLQQTDDRSGIEKLMDSMSVHFGFEVLYNVAYSNKHKISHHFIGMHVPISAKECESLAEHLDFVGNYVCNLGVTQHLIETLDNMRGHQPTNAEIQQAWNAYIGLERTFRNELILLFRGISSFYRKNTKHTESRVRELYDPNKRIAFPIGMSHATDSLTKSTLYSRIKDLNPVRIPLT